MKTAFYIFVSLCIFCGCYYGALNAKHPLALWIVAFSVLALMALYLSRRIKKNAANKEMRNLFQEYMRHQGRNRPQ